MVIIVAVAFFIWLLTLTFIIFKLRNHYYNLVSRTRKRKLDDILDYLLSTNDNFKKQINLIKTELYGQINKSKFQLQKIGLVRFNPFERMGGEQSFVLAFLDAENSGLIINFIYTPDGLRVYTKKVKKGKGEKHELSDEEKEAIENSFSTDQKT